MVKVRKKQAENGKKRSLQYLPPDRLNLDKLNPRLPEEAQGKSQSSLLHVLYECFNLDELADSLSQNGYFDEEPLVAFPIKLSIKTKPGTEKYNSFIESPTTNFTVVEGNRRLATIKLLLSTALRRELSIRTWPSLTKRIDKDLSELPTIIYPHRDYIVPYLGVRHIIGIQKWDSYARARYIAGMVENGLTVDKIQNQIGDRQRSARKYLLCYKLAEQVADEFSIDISPIKREFSLLMLATGQGRIKEFLGLPSKMDKVNINKPISKKHLNNLRDLVIWLYGDGPKRPIISDSRDITNYLSHILASPEATTYLKRTGMLLEAYERSGGEKTMLLKFLTDANRKLEASLGIAHLHRTQEVIDQVERCAKTIDSLRKAVKKIR